MSTFSQAVHPLFEAMAWLLAVFFGLVANYAFAIAMLTVVVMVLLSPLTLKSTRSMLAMQRLAPEMKKLQQRYKGDRQRLNEEMMALYKEHGASPAGGCLPMLLQMPAFIILYDTIRGLTNTVGPHHVPQPRYISHSTALYHHLMAGHGTMMAFGIDLAKSATSVHGGLLTRLPFYLLVVGSIGLQFLQMRQLTNRNPQAAAANPQMQSIQKFMPLIFGFIYISIAAGVNIYFLVSSMLRILQQELMYRYDPTLREAVSQRSVAEGSSVGKSVIKAKASPSGSAPAGGSEGADQPGAGPVPTRPGGLLAGLLGWAGASQAAPAEPPGPGATPVVEAAPGSPEPAGPSAEPAGAAARTGGEAVPRSASSVLGALFGSRAAPGGAAPGSSASPGNGRGASSHQAPSQAANGKAGGAKAAKGNGKAGGAKAANGKASQGTQASRGPQRGNGSGASGGKGKARPHPRSQSKRARRPR